MRGSTSSAARLSGEAWVGQAPNLETIQNRIWFSLRQGSHTCRSLQAAWTAHGPTGLTFGECERLEDEEMATSGTRC